MSDDLTRFSNSIRESPVADAQRFVDSGAMGQNFDGVHEVTLYDRKGARIIEYAQEAGEVVWAEIVYEADRVPGISSATKEGWKVVYERAPGQAHAQAAPHGSEHSRQAPPSSLAPTESAPLAHAPEEALWHERRLPR